MDHRLLFALSGGLLALAVVVAVGNHSREAYAEEWYKEIWVGMSSVEVDRLLGPPTEKVFTTLEGPAREPTGTWAERLQDRAGASAQWKIGRRMIAVGFSYGKVTAKMWMNADEWPSPGKGR